LQDYTIFVLIACLFFYFVSVTEANARFRAPARWSSG